tara:strand:- start:119 stop:541 length:423 start_codon:yes stop_codon:yes gene_type:complete
MYKFFKKEKLPEDNKLLSKTASLLIHAANIDENYTEKEKEIIKKTLIELGIEKNKVQEIMVEAEKNEKDSNHLLEFTKDIKNSKEEFKIKIIETLWTIIYSNNEADMYEANLMRRLAGLLYIDNKIMGDIKEKIKKKLSK